MQFNLPTAEIFIPDGLPVEPALARTTHLAIAAHPDDLEVMAIAPILACFQQPDQWFTGVVVTDGRGAPRLDPAADLRAVRRQEQRKAAGVGEYAAQIMLDYPSLAVQTGANGQVAADLELILQTCRPQWVYTHNLADKHDTHVGVVLQVIAALRRLPPAGQPQGVYGGEVWRDLDWLCDEDKVIWDCSAHENLQAALLGVFDSQISGGKRYDLAALGRRRAQATYLNPRALDAATGLAYGMDLTPLLQDPLLSPDTLVQSYLQRFAQEVSQRLTRVGAVGRQPLAAGGPALASEGEAPPTSG